MYLTVRYGFTKIGVFYIDINKFYIIKNESNL